MPARRSDQGIPGRAAFVLFSNKTLYRKAPTFSTPQNFTQNMLHHQKLCRPSNWILRVVIGMLIIAPNNVAIKRMMAETCDKPSSL